MRSAGVWHIPPFDIDPSERTLLRNGVELPLQPKTFDVLLVLLEKAGDLVSREELFRAVWAGTHVQDANLTNSIAILRRTLGADAIQTVSKFGYRLCIAVSGKPGISQAAWDFVSEGEAQMLRRPEGVTNARDLFLLAIAEEPGFAQAWAWLGRASRFLAKYRISEDQNRRLTEAAFRRAFALDPDLACAHQFYTTVQVDCGMALEAMTRLLNRVQKHPDEHSYAGLVQVCRFCGLLDASIAAHTLARRLNPAIVTSIPHTHFARCDYEAVVESYASTNLPTRTYLDAAAWACLRPGERIEADISYRLADRECSPLFEALLKSLLYALRGDGPMVQAICDAQDLHEDPESALYFARHLAWSGCPAAAITLLRQMVSGEFTVPTLLQQDPWLAAVRLENGFPELLRESIDRQRHAEQEFRKADGPHLLSALQTVRTGPVQPVKSVH